MIDEVLLTGIASQEFSMPAGQVFIGGELGILKIKAATKQGICGIVVKDNVSNLFLKYWLSKNMIYMLCC